jgi:hypothetical protein
MMLSRLVIVKLSLIAMMIAAKADDKDIVAKVFHTEPKYVVMNLPPRPDAWPGAIFTANMRLPLVHGNASDPAIHKGPPISIDSNSGFDLGAKTSGGISFLFGASAEAGDTANIVMSFPDASINDMDESELRKHVTAAKAVVDAAKRGQEPLIVIKSYSGTPTITITKKANASADAWARVKQDVKVGGAVDISSDDKISYKAGDNFVFAFETAQVIFDANDLAKGVYTIQLASLPATLYAFREEDSQERIARLLSATTGISVDAIQKNGILGGEASVFRKALGIHF